jgi:hypothetical protein
MPAAVAAIRMAVRMILGTCAKRVAAGATGSGTDALGAGPVALECEMLGFGFGILVIVSFLSGSLYESYRVLSLTD